MFNSGLGSIWVESMNFAQVDRWLAHPKLFNDRWVTEQTLHAMCASAYGLELLPPTYIVDTKPGMVPDAVCKHYPS